MKNKHSRIKSGVPLDDLPIKEGWLTRESNVVEKLLNKRYGALYHTVFVTYRKDTDESPSKVFQITRNTVITAVEDHTYHLRHENTSTLWAVARGAYDKVHMWGFSITFGSMTSGPDKLALAFETQGDAEEWHAAFEGVISQATLINHNRSASAISDASLDPLELAGTSFGSSSGTGVGYQRSLESLGASRKTRTWTSVLHINGVAVYVEEQDPHEEGPGQGAVMVSAVVRTPPVDVFKELVKIRKADGLGIFVGARTLEVIDANTQVVAQEWRASGLLGSLCAPRDMVLLRTWRKDEDGTYIVLYQSTTHRRSPQVKSSTSWRQPVRVSVQAAGFTVAPLMKQYNGGVESQECLVTLVLKADLGGFLSDGSLAGRLFGPLTGAAARGVLEPVVTSIVTIRDQVEQNRFVIRPLSMTTGSEEGDKQAEDAAARRKYGRTTTLLVFDRNSLAAAQIAQAERPAAESLVLDAGAIKSTPTEATTVSTESGTIIDLTAPVDDSWAIPGTCQSQYWANPGSAGFRLRGPDYLADKKKIPAAPPMFELVAVDLLQVEEPYFHICKHLPSVKHSPAPFVFCVQLMVPSNPPRSLVASWAAPMSMMGVPPEKLIAEYEAKQGTTCPDNVAAFFRTFTEFVSGDGAEADKRRNSKFKLIPNVAQGSWIVKQSVGTTPVLLGQKLTTKYYRGANYFEVDVDIGANSVAASITNLVCGATKSLAIDLGVLIEGQQVDQLPEQLIGTLRLDKLDLQSAAYFDEASSRVLKSDAL